MFRIVNLNFCFLSVCFIITTRGTVVYSSQLNITQVDLVSKYNGRQVNASLHSSITITWKSTGKIDSVSCGTKVKDRFAIEEVLVSLRENRPLHFPNVSLYNGRVNGSWIAESRGQSISFIVTSIKEIDNRIFMCTFEPKDVLASTVVDTVQVVVQGLPKATFILSFLSIGTGVDAMFTCNASGFPVPSIKWKRGTGSSEVEIKDDNGKYQVNSRSGSSELIIRSTNVSDRGYYICEASNFKSDRARAFLAVLSLYVDENMCPNSIDATIGESRTICCPVKGHPPPDILWQLPNGTSRNSEDITLPIVLKTENDFGGYRCLAKGLEEEVEGVVTVHKIEPVIITDNQTIVLKPGDKLTVEKVPGALGYMLQINETKFTVAMSFFFSGNILSFEIPYNSLVFKSESADEKPPKVKVTIGVVPIGVSGRQIYYTVEIHASATTLAVSLMTPMLSFVFCNLLQPK